MSELPSKSSLNHLGTKKVIVMNDKLAARVAKNPEAIEHLLNNFQATRAPHSISTLSLPLILLNYSHPAHPYNTQGSNASPTLVINLLSSMPGTIETGTIDDDGRTQSMVTWKSQDIVHQEEWRRAEQKLDNFMNQVLRSTH